ncbi:unnamed protein product [Paramecium sonneborni]|uniref:Uncharacterized protein n=1 Tax=Paramecium sonneborni TaxID=65129 RepID=A0A8S1JX80_9CILI|nr:unnamed protein product [Paramecium sonneborni]
MQNSNVLVTFGSQNLYFKLTDDPQHFMNAVCKQFNIKQFIAEIEGKERISLEFFNPNFIKKKDMLNIQQLGCKSIKIIEYKDQPNSTNQYQFFDSFIDGNDVQCCYKKDCQLCQGFGSVKFQEQDYQFINEVIRKKLSDRLLEIREKILRRDRTEISTPEDFLTYHQAKNNNQEFMEISTETIKYNFHVENSVINYDDMLKVKIIEQFDIEGEQGSEAIMKLKYMNDGTLLNWPEKVQLVCNEGPFQIRQDVKSALKGQTICTEIKIHIPDIPPQQYEFSCKFEYLNEHNKKVQFGPNIKLKLTVKEKIKQKKITESQNFDDYNRKLIPQIDQQLQQMGQEMTPNIQLYMNEIFKRFAHIKLDVNRLIDELFKAMYND